MKPAAKRQLKRDLRGLLKVWAWLTIAGFVLVVVVVVGLGAYGLLTSLKAG